MELLEDSAPCPLCNSIRLFIRSGSLRGTATLVSCDQNAIHPRDPARRE